MFLTYYQVENRQSPLKPQVVQNVSDVTDLKFVAKSGCTGESLCMLDAMVFVAALRWGPLRWHGNLFADTIYYENNCTAVCLLI